METKEILEKFAPKFINDYWLSANGALSGGTETILCSSKNLHALLDAHAQALVKLQEKEEAKNSAYSERNQCVAALARTLLNLGFKVGRALHPTEDTEWESDWRNILFIDLPTGQVSWHFHDSEANLIEGFPEYDEPWDGHSTTDKYKRLKTFPIEFWENSAALAEIE